MSTIVTRAGKGSPLVNNELDTNFSNLNSDKLENISADTSPQLGGNLDVQTHSIVTTSNRDLNLDPNGTGVVKVLSDSTTGALTVQGGDNGSNSAPDIVLYNDSTSPSANDAIGRIEFRGKDAGGGNSLFTSIGSKITNTTAGSESGSVFLSTFSGGTEYIGLSVQGGIGVVHYGNSLKLQATSGGVGVTGSITLSGTVDGVDVAARNSVLTSTTTTANAALPKSGGAMTGAITTAQNANLSLNPNGGVGNGAVVFMGDGQSSGVAGRFKLNCSANSHGITIQGPAHSAGASYTLTMPTTDGAANQVLKSDGSGVLSWVDQTADTNTTYSVGDGQLSQINFTDADHTKLNSIAASANNYSPPNHTGEITSSGDGATVIAGNVVDEANLKVSNGPVDGYMLTAQSGNTGGLTWAAQPSTSLPSLAGAGKVLTINAGNSASVWATPSGGGVSEDTVIALTIALG